MATGRKLTPDLLDIVAGRFKALGEPARLQILNALRGGEATVTEWKLNSGLKIEDLKKQP